MFRCIEILKRGVYVQTWHIVLNHAFFYLEFEDGDRMLHYKELPEKFSLSKFKLKKHPLRGNRCTKLNIFYCSK